tara:strand:- start:106 stop:285 length:180 start_codon:yes stop_codon:yes gene_type:complete
MKLDGDRLLAEIKAEIEQEKKDRDGAIKSGWFESAARIHLKIQGMDRVRQMIELGDFAV